jgi:hypothetical protein
MPVRAWALHLGAGAAQIAYWSGSPKSRCLRGMTLPVRGELARPRPKYRCCMSGEVSVLRPTLSCRAEARAGRTSRRNTMGPTRKDVAL